MKFFVVSGNQVLIILFLRKKKLVFTLKRLMTSALPPSASALQKLCQHGEKIKVHEIATLRATQCKLMAEKKTLGIDVQLNTARKERIEKNRSRLRPTVDCIITCGRQNLTLRGHRDHAHYYRDEEDQASPATLSKF